MSASWIDEAAERIVAALRLIGELRAGAEAEARAAVARALDALDLITREEFEATCALLEKTRRELAELERRVAALEDAHAER